MRAAGGHVHDPARMDEIGCEHRSAREVAGRRYTSGKTGFARHTEIVALAGFFVDTAILLGTLERGDINRAYATASSAAGLARRLVT